MNNEPLGSYERNTMSKLDLLTAALERDVLFAIHERKNLIEKISTFESTSSFDLDTFVELDAKEFASAFVLDVIKDAASQMDDEDDVIIEDYEEEWTFKIIRDRLMYRITSMTTAPRSTSPSHNMIENARHYALINILDKI